MATSTKTRRSSKPKESYSEKMARLRDKVERFNEEYDEDVRLEMIMRLASHGKGYSERNAALVLSQNPDAFDVRGHEDWDKAERVVTHGEHGIEILAPAGKKDGEQHEDGTKDKDQKFFRIAYVFDYSQTDPRSDHLYCEMCKRRPWSRL